ncbi:hypothetical protein CLAFUW4_00041 [Fulvia fulva]|uniref:F-box domain-containing protein n=1 Tax=Passalora fulva TaxID=5499 RepID=A0A9Q8L601_PASFU|nr:uncharacterized protein CLAFUR5_00040 [Fulvia fulva]KAK4635589.1 hypothetical protein CLAFUR4_00041 [Fulvia fulva]KAK4637873.1 hypothetical protein CLAFUR0_00040 [Fulvia fulva]UJO11500.1 hypothetical protein CLAFUR5_00040 [Fulvia fulva]WPV09509.1 hypothetical protein CLAFUW4_00041 [Fulvia fulva]WPV24984.1 hypothetical protein CLAFUW7_00041 [Fulvia fulva]
MATDSPFLDLPPEIRAMIYNYLTTKRHSDLTTHGPPMIPSRLTQTCRQIRTEFLAEGCRGRKLHVCYMLGLCTQLTDQYLDTLGASIIPLIKTFILRSGLLRVDIKEAGRKLG